MSALASLAHGHAAAPPFNGLFYATCATVIPVLFLAIAVQGHAYENLINTFTNAYSRAATPGPWHHTLRPAFTALIAAITTFYFLYSAIAEILAIYALYQQQAESSTLYFILAAIIFMVIITAADPAIALYRAVKETITNLDRWPAELPEPSPEPDETDPD
jgi:hypothetical protein